jgi:hypothetical protein
MGEKKKKERKKVVFGSRGKKKERKIKRRQKFPSRWPFDNILCERCSCHSL